MEITQKNINSIINTINRRVQTTTSEEKEFITDLLTDSDIDSMYDVEYYAREIAEMMNVREVVITDIIASEFNLEEE